MTEGEASAPWRCFVAVPLSEDVRRSVAPVVNGWREDLDARWTDPDGWHVSLHFVGALARGATERLATQLGEEVARAVGGEQFEVHVGGLGALPSARRARVLYLGVRDPDRRLDALATAARAAAATVTATAAERRAFLPHVTLARLRRPGPLDTWLAARPSASRAMPVTEVCLMRSHLGRGPARYEAIARYPLGPASGRAS